MATRDSGRSQPASPASADSSEFKLQLASGSGHKPREPSAGAGRIPRRAVRGACRASAGMNARFIAYLNLRNLFDTEPPPLTAFLSAGVELRSFRAGRRIYPLGQADPVLFVVERGMVEISLRRGPVRSRLKQVGEWAMFGEMPSVGMTMLQTRAIAIAGCSLLVLNRDAAHELMEKTAARWVGLIAPKLYDCVADRDRIKFGTTRSRLAALLLEARGAGNVVTGVTQQMFADTLGVAREQLWQALRGLREDGLVLWNRSRVELPDIEGLIRAASVWSGQS
jgi:CRP-like cAMP-binding protein